MLPFVVQLSGRVYLVGAPVLNGIFPAYAVRIQREAGNRLAVPTFTYSIVYLMGLFTLLLPDRYLGLFQVSSGFSLRDSWGGGGLSLPSSLS